MNDIKNESKRGRPRKLDKEIGLQQATELFLRHGFELVSINDLSEKLGVPATSIYATFGNKQTLFEYVLQVYSRTFFGQLETALTQAKNASQVFRIVLEFVADFYLNHNQKQGCLILQSSSHCKHKKVQSLVNEKQQVLHSVIILTLQKHEAENAQELAHALMTLIRGMAATIKNGADEDEIFTTTEFFCSAFDC